MKRALLLLFSVGLLTACAAKQAEEAVDTYSFNSGEHYTVLEQPLPDAVAPVIEFFYFGCRACYQLADAVAGWSEQTGIPVALVPAHTDTKLVDAARLYHTLAEMGEVQHYKAGYVLFQTNNSSKQGEARVNEFLQALQIDQERFWQVWGSDAVNQRLAGSFMLTRAAGITSTPAFVVQGRYRVEPSVIESVDELFALLEHLAALPAEQAK
jgi:thiol:disulfide interchange protein DsbA